MGRSLHETVRGVLMAPFAIPPARRYCVAKPTGVNGLGAGFPLPKSRLSPAALVRPKKDVPVLKNGSDVT